jgi:hypothetical protein
MTILCYFKTSLVTFVQRITLKSMFSKKAYKSVARVPVSVVYLFTCISRFNGTIPKKIGDPRSLTVNLFL